MEKVEQIPSKSDETSEEQLAELVRLKRQFRLLEDDRRAHKDETENMLKKQQGDIQSLKNEHGELTKETKLAGSLQIQHQDRKDISKLHKLLEEEKHVKNEMILTQEKSSAINKQHRETQKSANAYRRNIRGGLLGVERSKNITKLNSVLENRLGKASVKFNCMLAENARLREEINHISEQRLRFVELQQKLSEKFQAGKQEKDSLIEKSIQHFTNRDESQHRMQSLRERSERDMNLFNAELKDLQRVIDHDKKLREFMRTKAEERNEFYEAAANRRKEKKLLDHTKSLQVRVEHYESIFYELCEVSELSNIDEMVEKFIRIDDQNFTLYNFVKGQSQSIQKNEVDVHNLKQLILKIREDDVRIEKRQKEILNRLEQREQNEKERRKECVDEIKTKEGLLERICSKVNDILDSTYCNRSKMTELLGGSKICPQNMLSYLGLIEQRASELVQAKALIQMRNGEDVLLANSEHVVNTMSFATVGKIAHCIMGLASLKVDILSADNSIPLTQFVKPISHTEAREIATLNRIDLKVIRNNFNTAESTTVNKTQHR